MKRFAVCICYLLLLLRLNAQKVPDTDDLRAINCGSRDFYSGRCSAIWALQVVIKKDGSSYPDDGFCIINNTLYDDIVDPEESASYSFTAAVGVGYHSFEGGIFFNFQDENNYDTFYTRSLSSEICIVGYVENGTVYETDTFTCLSYDGYDDWFTFEVTAFDGQSSVRLYKYDQPEGLGYEYIPHFPTTPNAGPLHVNDQSVHNHLHFADFNMTIIDAPTTIQTTTEWITTEEEVLTTRATTEVTTDVPSDLPQPVYQIRMDGNFVSSTGTDFSQSCITSYSFTFDEKMAQMRFVVNTMIGSQLCTERTIDDIEVVFTSGFMSFDGSQGLARPSFYLQVASHLYMSEFEACAADISAFLLPHYNWGEYVAAPVKGCPEVDFLSNEFNSKTDIWVCTDPGKSETHLAIETPRYGIGHIGDYNVDGEVDLGPDCQGLYSTVLLDNTGKMVSGINNPEGSHLCGDLNVHVSLNSAYLTGGGGSSGASLQDYILELSGDMRFSDIYTCANSILAYLSPHSNWMDPIIPRLPGCPGISFSPEQFQERFQQWICVSAKENQMKPGTGNNNNHVILDQRRENEEKEMARKKMKKLFYSYLKLD